MDTALLDVVSAAPRSPERVSGDFGACQSQAAASGGAGPTAGEITAGRLGGVVTTHSDPLEVRRHTDRSKELEARLSACLTGRGY